MRTLTNVTPEKGNISSPNIGFTANVSPNKTNEGVSVRYIPDPTKKWFVLRASYHREKKAYDYLMNLGVECFLPLHQTLKYIHGKRQFITESFLPNLLFVYASPETIETCIIQTPQLHFLSYYYDHFTMGEDGKNPPLIVPYDKMMNFIKIANINNPHIKLVQPEQCHYKSGDMVRIVNGEFKGIEGRVARVAGQQRVVVKIEGLCLISTAYIPSAFIEKKCSTKE